jgi:hypothetical protein
MKENRKKLNEIKADIENNLANNLPVGFRNLVYKENIDSEARAIKVVSVKKNNTDSYCVISHYKPISKCIADT